MTLDTMVGSRKDNPSMVASEGDCAPETNPNPMRETNTDNQFC